LSIRDAAAIRDYHELDFPGVDDRNAIEKRLSDIESPLAEALAHALQNGIASPEIHCSIIELVALLRVRAPAFKAGIDAFLQNVVRSTGKMLEQRGELPPPPPGLENVLRIDNLSVEISNWKILEYMFRIASDRRLFDILTAMKPTMLRAPEGTFFLTCDQPVAIFHPIATPTDDYGVGLVDLATEVSVPLSATALLHLSWRIKPDSDLDKGDRLATTDEMVEFNRRTVVMASSLVFAPEPSQVAIETTTRHSHCSAGVDLDVLEGSGKTLHLARFRPVMRPDRYGDQPS